jgi:hypothetical protein
MLVVRSGFSRSYSQGSCVELACESTCLVASGSRTLYPRYYLTMGLYNFWYLVFSRCDYTGSYNPWESVLFSPLISHMSNTYVAIYVSHLILTCCADVTHTFHICLIYSFCVFLLCFNVRRHICWHIWLTCALYFFHLWIVLLPLIRSISHISCLIFEHIFFMHALTYMLAGIYVTPHKYATIYDFLGFIYVCSVWDMSTKTVAILFCPCH